MVPAQAKRNLLGRILNAAGAAEILRMGQGVREGTYDPIWRAAVNAQSPLHLMNGWRRLEAYAHSKNRVKMTPAGDREIRFQRYTVGGVDVPSDVENLLICGIVIALLEEIGCRELRCVMPLKDGHDFTIYAEHTTRTPDRRGDSLQTSSWSIDWQSFVPARPERELVFDSAYLGLPPDCNARSRKSVEEAVRLLVVDFVRQWKINELANELGQSTRSFQRNLKAANLNFSRLIRYLRVQEACRLIEARTETLAAVGYCAGFSDSAHFSRDFRASMGMTPTAFRNALVEI